MLPYPIVVSHLSFNFLCCYSVVSLSVEQKKRPFWLKNRVLTLIVILPSLAGGEWLSRHDLYNFESREGEHLLTGLTGAAQLHSSIRPYGAKHHREF
jgi:hypothetical protein